MNTNVEVMKIYTNIMKLRKYQIPSDKEEPNSAATL